MSRGNTIECLSFQPLREEERKAWKERTREGELLAGVTQHSGVGSGRQTRTKKRVRLVHQGNMVGQVVDRIEG